VPGGVRRGPWIRRLKRGSTYVANHPFDFSHKDALDVALRFYKMDRSSSKGDLL
jgi:hypothetical protein